MLGLEIHVDIPAIYCPFAPAMHPKADDFAQRGVEFMGRHGFCATAEQRQMVEGTASSVFYSSISPDGEEERMQVAVDWCYLMFAFDDLRCDMGPTSERPGEFAELANRLLRTLEAPDSGAMGEDTFAAPVRDIAHRVHRLGSPNQVRRWIDGHYQWFLGVLWEVAWRTNKTMPNLDDYLHARLRFCAGAPTTSWIEFVNDINVPGHEMNAPETRALTEMTWMIAALDDDLVSYGKDLWYQRRQEDAGGSTQPSPNIIDVLATQRNCSTTQATVNAVAIRDSITCQLINIRDRVLSNTGTSPALRHYLADLANLIRGNAEYGTQADRYTNPDGASPNAIQMTWSISERAPLTGSDPLPCPSIHWWWTV